MKLILTGLNVICVALYLKTSSVGFIITIAVASAYLFATEIWNYLK